MIEPIAPTFEGDYQFGHDRHFELYSGESIPGLNLHYAVYGKLSPSRDNAILACHALSGSARVGDWWPQLFGERGVFDLKRHCIIGVNLIGSCYGSTGPGDINPQTGKPYGKDFPLVTVRDWVRSQSLLLDHLGIEKLQAVIGGSIGGMQAIQWSIDFPERVPRTIAIGAAPLTAMGLALNHLQRLAIINDSAAPPSAGLALARAIAMCTYKSERLFNERYGRNPNRNGEDPNTSLSGRYDVGGYLDYQGEIFTRRFSADSYLLITKAMDNFHPSRGYASEEEALRRIRARALLVGISSDWLFPVEEVRGLAEKMRSAGADAHYEELHSSHGHDGFLAEPDSLAPFIRKMIE